MLIGEVFVPEFRRLLAKARRLPGYDRVRQEAKYVLLGCCGGSGCASFQFRHLKEMKLL